MFLSNWVQSSFVNFFMFIRDFWGFLTIVDVFLVISWMSIAAASKRWSWVSCDLKVVLMPHLVIRCLCSLLM